MYVPYHPQSAGIVEQMNLTITTAFQITVKKGFLLGNLDSRCTYGDQGQSYLPLVSPFLSS